MADSNPQWHGRAQKLPSSPSATGPLSPASASSNPISFRTNVNRSKTKRWLEAKQYSYDGGEWGDEDDEEDEHPAVPQPPYATDRTGSPSELSSRRLSGLVSGADDSRRGSSSAEAVAASGGGEQKVLPFIRPADIYKRMREERGSEDSGRQNEVPQSAVQPGSGPTQAAISGSDAPKAEGLNAPSVGLPELKRISAFGTDFLGGDSGVQQHAHPDEQTSLHHNPSQASSDGFTSVVHQAFDVPETPNSTAGSVVRSNSDGTSVISPIISSRGPYNDKTPTIPEEPDDGRNTPTGAPDEHSNEALFQPGHRRDMSLPNRDNSPSKRPVVTDHDAPAYGQAEMSSIPATGQDYNPSPPAERDFVAPLKFGSNGASGSEGYHGDIPTIVPAMSAGTSPQDADNDRLREEIMLSLSRDNSEEPEPPTQGPLSQAPGESIPHQYEKYWDDHTQTAPDLDETPKPLVSESHPDWPSSHPLATQDPYAASQTLGGEAPSVSAEPPNKPRLARRFSWESSSSSDEPAPQVPGSYASPPPLGAALTAQEPEPLPDYTLQPAEGMSREAPMTDGEASDSQRVEKPRLSIVPPIPENTTPPPQIMRPVDAPQSRGETLPLNVGTLDLDESKLQGFREIITMTSPDERIRAFDRTRDQFAALNTGLNHWIEFTVHDHPEYADLTQSSQSLSAGLPRSSPTSRKFPKLASLGNLASRDESIPTSAGHNRRPSGHIGTIVNRQNVEQRGKEFLHTAGAFSGKAGEAAKGLFAKGRSKFRPSGDKGQSTTGRKSLQFQFFYPSESPGSHGNFSLRNSTFGSLPVFKSGRNESHAAVRSDARDPSSLEDQDGERAGKRFKSSKSMDMLRSQNHVGGSTKPLPLSPHADRRRSQGIGGKSNYANDFEQEMNAALGLSPTDPRPQQPASVEPALRASGALDQNAQGQQQSKNVIVATERVTGAPTTAEKSLPAVPDQRSDGSVSPSAADEQSQPGVERTIPSIRPFLDKESKPAIPPKDLPPKDIPPKDQPLKEISLKNLAPLPRPTTRQASVSTLGPDEQSASHPPAGEIDSPPSPLQPSTDAEISVYEKPLPRIEGSGMSLPSADADTGFAPMHPRTQSSAEILASKRKSLSALPPSAPGVQSPLRNEVRYSPGTRSSMLSFGSFGRQSTNSRGTRPATPANELSQRASAGSPAQNGDSKMHKLKSFGQRRRASVGDILSGLQENIQEGIHRLPEGGKRKRTFSRISGLFGRSRESQSAESDKDDPASNDTQDPNFKVLPRPPSDGHAYASTPQNGQFITNGLFTDKALPAMPALDSQSPHETAPPARDPRPRASVPLPLGSSSDSLMSGRFYSQIEAADTASPARHTRAKSQPMLAPPLSPIAPSVSDRSVSHSSHLHDIEERESQKDQQEVQAQARLLQEQEQTADNPKESQRNQQAEEVQVPQTEHQEEDQKEQSSQKQVLGTTDPAQSILNPNLGVRSRKPVVSQPESISTTTTTNNTTTNNTNTNTTSKDIPISSASTLTYHPHRESDPRVLNETTEPVELAMTKDDSSEEIVMSPTAYPGQEWTPMHM